MNNVTNIDYELLAEQREVLLNSIWQDEQSPLWGVVDLLDEFIDAEEGIKVNRWFEKKRLDIIQLYVIMEGMNEINKQDTNIEKIAIELEKLNQTLILIAQILRNK